MFFSKPIVIKGKMINEHKEPLICTPLIGSTKEAILGELATILPKQPDLIEWRIDFFTGIADVNRILEAGKAIKAKVDEIPIIFTRRSIREGGQPILLDEAQVFERYAAVCRAGWVDLFDYELSVGDRYFRQAVALARETGIPLIASFHDFQKTPNVDALVAKFVAMEEAGADIAKIAVMPQELRDVLTVLEATLAAHNKISLPIISMAMGAYGSLSRLFGWVFGSAVSFAVGEKSSAPGQIPIEQLNTVVDIMRCALEAGRVPKFDR